MLEERRKLLRTNNIQTTEGIIYFQIVNQAITNTGGDNYLNFDVEYKTDAGGRYADYIEFRTEFNSSVFVSIEASDITLTYSDAAFNNPTNFSKFLTLPTGTVSHFVSTVASNPPASTGRPLIPTNYTKLATVKVKIGVTTPLLNSLLFSKVKTMVLIEIL